MLFHLSRRLHAYNESTVARFSISTAELSPRRLHFVTFVVYLDQLTASGTAAHALTAVHGGMTQVKTGQAKVSRILIHPLRHLEAASVLNTGSVWGLWKQIQEILP